MAGEAAVAADPELRARSLLDWFEPNVTALVAFSGGVDSGLVTAAAARALGAENVVAATAVSDALASGECEGAAAFCASIGVRHVPVPTNEIDVEGYRANKAQRCYFCKSTIIDVLVQFAEREHIDLVLTGTNADDMMARFRPGIRASLELGAKTPLADVGLTKDQVRGISALWDLALANKPATACLSSRIAYGVRITRERLARVDAAEAEVRRLLAGIGETTYDLRVRDLGTRARVEVDAHLVSKLQNNSQLQQSLVAVGFPDDFVDVRVFESGSMNVALGKRTGDAAAHPTA